MNPNKKSVQSTEPIGKNRLSGKVAVITGGLSGIGAATAQAFLSAGAKVVISDINKLCSPLPASADNLIFVHANVSSSEDTAHLIRETISAFGAIDILVNNAGIGELAPSHELSFEDWRKTLAVNLDGCFLVSQAVIQQMLVQESHIDSRGVNHRGAIINVASIHGLVGFPNHAAYSASKGAVVNLTRSLGIEYAKHGIRVNAVCPGFIHTPLIEKGVSDEMMPRIETLHPIGRIGWADEVARPIVFLASDEASFITGAHLAVDGGYTAQ